MPPVSAGGERTGGRGTGVGDRILVLVEPVGIFRAADGAPRVRLETKMLDEVWRFYSEEISDIDPLKTNVSITVNYRNVHPGLPLPATFAIDLGERISRRSPGNEVRVFSRYPWPSRKKGGPQTDFDVEALTYLEGHAKSKDALPEE